MHFGPLFPTCFSHNSSTNPCKCFSNKHHYSVIEPGDITISDHLPVILKLSTTPFIIEKQKIYKTNKANWDLFHYKLDSQINVTSVEGGNDEQLENATRDWIKTVKSDMDIAIPFSTHQYIYQ